MSHRPLSFHLLLGAAGAALGVVAWAILGIGLVELGVTARFDPFGVAEEPPPATPLVTAAEWSLPVFAVVGAVLTPRITAWLLVNPRSPSA